MSTERRVFKVKAFDRFANTNRIGDAVLLEAIAEVYGGLVDADLGGGVIKKRIARPGAGKSGGYRTIIAFGVDRHSFFVHGFAKNVTENITPVELKALRVGGGTLARPVRWPDRGCAVGRRIV